MPEISTQTTPTAQSLDWIPVPAEIAQLGGSALVAWARIASAGICNPADPSTIVATIGLADLDLSDTTARNAIGRLETTGLLHIDRAPGKASTYTLHRSTAWAQLPVAMAELDAGPIAAWCALYMAGTFEDTRRNTTVRRLASWLGAGLRTVRRWLAELVQTSFVKRQGDYDYTLTPPTTPPVTPPKFGRHSTKTESIPTRLSKNRESGHTSRRPKWIEEIENMVRPRIPDYTPPEPVKDALTPEQTRRHIAALRATFQKSRQSSLA